MGLGWALSWAWGLVATPTISQCPHILQLNSLHSTEFTIVKLNITREFHFLGGKFLLGILACSISSKVRLEARNMHTKKQIMAWWEFSPLIPKLKSWIKFIRPQIHYFLSTSPFIPDYLILVALKFRLLYVQLTRRCTQVCSLVYTLFCIGNKILWLNEWV